MFEKIPNDMFENFAFEEVQRYECEWKYNILNERRNVDANAYNFN